VQANVAGYRTLVLGREVRAGIDSGNGQNSKKGFAVRRIRLLAQDRQGVTALEYGLIASLIAVVIIGAVTLLGSNISITFSQIATTL